MKVDNTTIPAAEIRAACKLILASDLFSNAPRLSRLLHFLVEKAISGDTVSTREYAIGIEVFERQPAYNTGEDPIVRVQAGRLRTKLQAYYAAHGAGSDIEITIPVGCYMPVIRRVNIPGKFLHARPALLVEPLKCVSQRENEELFTQGLHDELVHHMHRTLTGMAVTNSSATPYGVSGMENSVTSISGKIGHRLEGSVQIDAEHIRVSLRLVDAATGRITWSEQFIRKLLLTIAVQEELTMSICSSLKRFLDHRNPPPRNS